jgi:hypothetical protein
MARWRARVDFLTPAGGLRTWEDEVEAENAELASELAMRAFRASRPGRVLPPIARLRPRAGRG